MKGFRQFLLTTTLLIMLFCYAMFQGGFVSWFLFFSYLTIYIYQISFMLYPMKKWELSRTIDQSVIYAGDELKFTIIIKRKIPFPLPYCVVEDIVPESLQKRTYPFYLPIEPIHHDVKPFKKMIFPWFRREMRLEFSLDRVPRGEHQLKDIHIKTNDLFGFISKEHQYAIDMLLKVYPRRATVAIAKQMTGFEQGDVSAPALHYKSAHIASGIREYASGDKLSWINWKQTARKNKLMTKEFEQEKSTDTLIVLDRTIDGLRGELTFEGAVELVSGLIEVLYKNTSNLGFLSIGDSLFDIPLYDHPNKVQTIREHCMKAQPTKNARSFQQLKEQLSHFRHECVVIIITTRLNPAFVQSVLSINQRSRQVIVIFVQYADDIGKHTTDLIQSLKQEKVMTTMITEQAFQNQVIEVNV